VPGRLQRLVVEGERLANREGQRGFPGGHQEVLERLRPLLGLREVAREDFTVLDEPVGVERLEGQTDGAVEVRSPGAPERLVGEKQVFCVDAVFDALLTEMARAGGRLLSRVQIEALTRRAFVRPESNGALQVNRALVGRDAAVLAEAAGLIIPPSTRLLLGETEDDHPFVQTEQMMPFVPFVRVKDVDEAIALAIESEHGCHHTAVIHSRNVDTITRFGHDAAVTLFFVNGPSLAGLGLGGQGYLTYSIATPTGEGMTNPLTFTRYRRVVMTDSLRMI
jgi:aldehyde dehydrogenase